MVDRIVFHIGTHKTGTTAIQGSLGDAYDSLLERGVLYPLAGRLGTGHAGLGKELVETTVPITAAPSHVEILEEVRATEPRTVVIAAELLSSPSTRPAAWARSLCDELRPASVDVIAYVRPQWDWIVASYAQRVKTGTTWTSFDSFLEEQLETGFRFHFSRHVEHWREAFGEGLAVRPYAPELLIGGDAVTDFWHVVGLGAPPALHGRHSNRRAGARRIEMLRALRELLADSRLDELLPVRKALRRASRVVDAELPHDRPFSPLTPELLERIAGHFRRSNASFVRDYMGGRDGGVFSPPTGVEEPTIWSMDQASERELRLFGQLVEGAMRDLRGTQGSPDGGRPRLRAVRAAGVPPSQRHVRTPKRSALARRRPGGLRVAVRRLRRRVGSRRRPESPSQPT